VIFDQLRRFVRQTDRGWRGAEGGQLLERAPDRLRLAAGGLRAAPAGDRHADLEAACGRFFGAPLRVELAPRARAGRAGAGGPRRSGAPPPPEALDHRP
jgi:hypothetical protein